MYMKDFLYIIAIIYLFGWCYAISLNQPTGHLGDCYHEPINQTVPCTYYLN